MNKHNPPQLFPRMTVGVMGSAGGEIEQEIRERLRSLGATIARRGYVLITGACPGLPHDAVLGAKGEGGVVVGISPALNLHEHITKYHSPTRGYDAIVYTGSGLMGREIENIRSCDAVIFAGGEGKVIGILTDTGGITEHLRQIITMVNKETGAFVCYDNDPDALMDKLEDVYSKRVLPAYKKMMKNHDPDGTIEK